MAESDVQFAIRRADQPQDFHHIYELVKEMAQYEKMTNKIVISAEKLQADGMSDPPLFQCFVAVRCSDNCIVGYAMYYNVYSSFQGKAMFLEDIYVSPTVRGQKVGSQLYQRVAKEAIDTGCQRLDFIVLNWNQSAKKFHEKNGAQNLSEKEDWALYRIEQEELKLLSKS